MLIAVPGLHQCGRHARSAAALVSEVLDPLLALRHVRLVAEVRDASAIGFNHPAHVIDLSDMALTNRGGFAEWYAALADGAPTVPVERVFPHPVPARLAASLPAGAAPEDDPAAAWWTTQPAPVRAALRTLALARGPLDPLHLAASAHRAPPDRGPSRGTRRQGGR